MAESQLRTALELATTIRKYLEVIESGQESAHKVGEVLILSVALESQLDNMLEFTEEKE